MQTGTGKENPTEEIIANDCELMQLKVENFHYFYWF
jgi:hypothetical protein